MEQVCRVLLEKLDKSVCVGTPQFYHSAECLSRLRYEKHAHHTKKDFLFLDECRNCN